MNLKNRNFKETLGEAAYNAKFIGNIREYQSNSIMENIYCIVIDRTFNNDND